MKSGGTSFARRIHGSIILVFFLQISFTARGETTRNDIWRRERLCTTPPCVHSASELLEWRDTDVDPCEDFFEFTCGNYDRSGIMQSAYSFWNQFRYTQQHIDALTKEILSKPTSCEEPDAITKAKYVYQACMNTGNLAAKGTLPLLNILDAYGSWPVLSRGFVGNEECSGLFTWNDVGRAASQLGISMIFNIVVRPNFFNSSQLLIYILHDTLPTPVPLASPREVEPYEKLPWDFVSNVNLGNPYRTSKEANLSPQPVESDNLYVEYLSKVVRAIWDSRPPTELNDFTRQDNVDQLVRVELRKVTKFMQNLKATNDTSTHGGSLSQRMAKLGIKRTYGIIPISELQNYTDQILPVQKYKMNWLEFLQTVFSHADVAIKPDDMVYVESLEKLMNVLRFVDKTESRTLENFVGSRIASYLAPETTDELWKTAKWFYQQLKYITEDYARWMHCNHVVSDYPGIGLGMAVAYEYKKNYFEQEKLDEAVEMVLELKTAFKDLLHINYWMDNQTKSYALEKLDAMLMLIGFPEWLSDINILSDYYKTLTTDPTDHFGNVVRIKSFVNANGLKTLRKDRTRNEWTQSPLITNAFYNTLNNRITFPAGIMSRPFFSGSEVEALDFGRIGAIVGHEITHAFDSSGRSFDKYGTLHNWWSEDVLKQYLVKANCFIEQYSNYTDPYNNAKVDGKLTLAENIADNGGLRQSFRAYKRKLAARKELLKKEELNNPLIIDDCFKPYPGAGGRLPGLERYTNEQLFFLGYASIWCDFGRSAQAQSKNDNHAPNRFRVIGGLSNMEEFAEAWSCPKGSPMNPKNKCVLW